MNRYCFVSKTKFLAFISLAFAGMWSATPVRAQTLSAGLAHTCAIGAGGAVLCWGSNSVGQLGDGSLVSRAVPARAQRLDSGIVAVAATSEARSCALRSNGEVLCWGANALGELGDGTSIDRQVPTRVVGLGPDSGVTAIALGTSHACALRGEDGVVLCWGSNTYGQVGGGGTGGVLPVTTVSGLRGVIAIAVGEDHSCAVKSDQSVYCWGHNAMGSLGDGTLTNRDVPTPVMSLGAGSGAVRVSAGNGYSCAVLASGAVWCWGANWAGQLGTVATGARFLAPVLSSFGSHAGAVETVGLYGHACARTGAGAVYCSGMNNFGQLGDGTYANKLIPVPVLSLDADVSAIAVGYYQSCARKIGGAVLCWGLDTNGRSVTVPVAVNLDDSIFRNGFDK